MKPLALIILLFFINIIGAQEKLMSDNNVIVFEASVPFFEPVEAINRQVFSVLNTKKGYFSVVVFVKAFEFERELMQSHFNSNYMESKKYPKATFKGLIEKFDLKSLGENPKDFYIKGKINVHGKTKNIRVPAKIKKVEKGIDLKSNFSLNTDDFDIEIPYIVRSKISKNVNISLHAVLQ